MARIVELTNVGAAIAQTNTVYEGNSQGEEMATLRMRLKTNTPENPWVDGHFQVIIRWHDGNVFQTWVMALETIPDNFNELGIDILQNLDEPLTYQVVQIAPGGSIDILLLHAFIS